MSFSILSIISNRQWSGKAVAWIVYDGCNTIFHTGILGLFFPLWITTSQGGNDAHFGYAVAVSMCIVILGSPFIGRLFDVKWNRYSGLAWFTGISSLLTILMGILNVGLTAGLALFIGALVCLTFAELLYNAALADVADPSEMGTIGGLGIGLGYLGSVMAVVIGLVGIDYMGLTYDFSFWTIGIIMALLASPLIILGPRKQGQHQFQEGESSYIDEAFRSKAISLDSIKEIFAVFRIRSVGTFLMARFWYLWMVSVGSSFGVLYATQTVGMTAEDVQRVLLAALVLAVPSGYLWGKAVDRYGSTRCLISCLCCWIVVLGLAIAVPVLGLPSATWWIIGLGAGSFYGAIWVADRPLVVFLAPPDQLNAVFGMYMTVGRLGYAIGSACWPLVAVTFGWGQPAAMGVLVVCTVIAIGFLVRLHQELQQS